MAELIKTSRVYDDIRIDSNDFNNMLFIKFYERTENGEFKPIISNITGTFFTKFDINIFKEKISSSLNMSLSKMGFTPEFKDMANKTFEIEKKQTAKIIIALQKFCREFNFKNTVINEDGKEMSILNTIKNNYKETVSKKDGETYVSYRIKINTDNKDEDILKRRIKSTIISDGKNLTGMTRSEFWETVKGNTYHVKAKGVYGAIYIPTFQIFNINVSDTTILMIPCARNVPYDPEDAIAQMLKDVANITAPVKDGDDAIAQMLKDAANITAPVKNGDDDIDSEYDPDK